MHNPTTESISNSFATQSLSMKNKKSSATNIFGHIPEDRNLIRDEDPVFSSDRQQSAGAIGVTKGDSSEGPRKFK